MKNPYPNRNKATVAAGLGSGYAAGAYGGMKLAGAAEKHVFNHIPGKVGKVAGAIGGFAIADGTNAAGVYTAHRILKGQHPNVGNKIGR